jgi:hypothetical protein
MGEPPVEFGAVHVTVTFPLAPTADVIAGAPGTVIGVTEDETAEAALEPMALVALTVNVYAVPFINPATVHVKIVAPVAVQCLLVSDTDVAVYPVMAEPPFEFGAVQLTVTCAFPETTVTPVGDAGGPSGVAEFVGDDAALEPEALVAMMVKM